MFPAVFYLKFQFHKGTIKTGTTRRKGSACRRFQFHKGTIKTGAVDKIGKLAHMLFQFHKGTIKTCKFLPYYPYLIISIP